MQKEEKIKLNRAVGRDPASASAAPTWGLERGKEDSPDAYISSSDDNGLGCVAGNSPLRMRGAFSEGNGELHSFFCSSLRCLKIPASKEIQRYDLSKLWWILDIYRCEAEKGSEKESVTHKNSSSSTPHGRVPRRSA